MLSVPKELNFKYLKFAGIFNEEMMIYNEDEFGEVVYNWGYVDKIFDFLIKIYHYIISYNLIVNLLIMKKIALISVLTASILFSKENVEDIKSKGIEYFKSNNYSSNYEGEVPKHDSIIPNGDGGNPGSSARKLKNDFGVDTMH